MKCLVPVKRVVDYNVKVHVKLDGSGIDTEHTKMSMNPFDEIALEEAVRLKESGVISEIVAVSIGQRTSEETLRVALARGADRAVLIECDRNLEPINIAKLLHNIAEKEAVRLVIMGKQAIDDDCHQTGQMLAGLLGWAQGTNVSKLMIKDLKQSMEITREVDGGLERIDIQLPAVLTVDLRLNEPRYLSLPNIMRAKNKPIQYLNQNDFNIELKMHVKLLKVEPPAVRRAGIKVENVKELVDKLKNEAKVI